MNLAIEEIGFETKPVDLTPRTQEAVFWEGVQSKDLFF